MLEAPSRAKAQPLRAWDRGVTTAAVPPLPSWKDPKVYNPMSIPTAHSAALPANEPGPAERVSSTHRGAGGREAQGYKSPARCGRRRKPFQQDLSPVPTFPAFPQPPRGFPAAKENKRRCFLLSPPPARPRLSGSNPPRPPPLRSLFSSHPSHGKKGTNLCFSFFFFLIEK